MSRTELFEQIDEILVYLQVYAPSIPSHHPTSLEGKFHSAIGFVRLASDFVKTEDAKRFLDFCVQDLEKSHRAYAENDEPKGLRHLESARHWLEEARKDRPSRPTFIVGPDGEAEKC